jgi:carboxyl-terminal processing protease
VPVRQDDRAFAEQLLDVAHQVADKYVRPVSCQDLVYAALAGLYEAARLPQPARLQTRVEKATTDLALVEVIRQARAQVGDAEDLGNRNVLAVCCQAVARTLDPYSGVVTTDDLRFTLGLETETGGVGVEVTDNPGPAPVLVQVVYPGGPAQRAGLRPGDRITHLDGRRVEKLSSFQVRHQLHLGPPAPDDPDFANQPPVPPLQVTYRRGEGKSVTVILDRARFRVETVLGVARRDDNRWNYLLDARRRIAHVRLAVLGRGTAAELAAVLAGLQEDGLKGLILDLRWCPGGYLDEAVNTARLFLGDKVLATVKGRGAPDVVHRGRGVGRFTDLPLVVLVNGETVGGAELLAAALQDHGRAAVVGQRTRGKGTMQTQVPLGLTGVGVKLTTGTFVRPNGRNLHRFPDSTPGDDWGVRPDHEVRLSADLNRTLRQWWLLQTLRPGSSVQSLPLDDPTADPVRYQAVPWLVD